MNKVTALCLLALALLSQRHSEAFVFYLVGGDKLMRWNLTNTTRYHTNVVNPVTKKIRYFIAEDAWSTNNRLAELQAVRAAFDQWQAVPGAKIAFEEGGLLKPGADVRYDNTNVVFWVKKNPPIVGGIENLSGRRAWTSVVFSFDDGRILEADIALNGTQNQWFTDFGNSTNIGAFVEAVVAHEIGHFLGLDHTPAGGGTVLVSAGPGVSLEAGLSADETAAARYLYPDPAFKWGAIKGKVTVNGNGILGAVVAVEDSQGRLAGATLTRGTGDFELHSLPPGTFHIRVSPLDPLGAPSGQSLIRGDEIAPDYASAATAFRATAARALILTNGQVLTTNIAVASGNPPFRITSISKPSSQPDVVNVLRYAVALEPGQSNQYVSVHGPQLPANSSLTVTGDGITMGSSVFKPNRFTGLHTITAPISISSNATPGLRTFVVQNGTNYAYAHGFLEISPPYPDHNFDGFDDRFQRQYWNRWTTNAAAPNADPDQDRFSNSYEYRTGSNPTNQLSHNFVVDRVRLTASGAEVSWHADHGTKYQLYGRAAFQPGAVWQPVGPTFTARTNYVTIPDPAAPGSVPQEKFYRIQLVP